MKQYSFSCMRDSLRIIGHAFVPEQPGSVPAIIISHGFTGNLSDNDALAERFCADGYAAFTFSFCGGSQDATPAQFKSDGDSVGMSLRSEVRDLLAVIDYVRALPEVDSGRINLLGFSQGG